MTPIESPVPRKDIDTTGRHFFLVPGTRILGGLGREGTVDDLAALDPGESLGALELAE